MAKKLITEILREAKNFYIEQSMTYSGKEDFKPVLQALALTTMLLDQKKDEKYAIRDTRNFMFKQQKEIKGTEQKKLLKEMLKIIK